MHRLKLLDLYAAVGVSKQAMYKYRMAVQAVEQQEQRVVAAMAKMRQHHKKMSSRKVYVSQKEAFQIQVGRDKFEAIAFAHGYRVKHKRQVSKTTRGQREEVYPDLVSGTTIDNINQVYQSDIFYLKVADKDYYGVTIIDVYSKRLVALSLSKTLRATENVAALKKLARWKTKAALKGCIFHSDRGSQYISKAQKALLQALGMRISMGKRPQQNAYVERYNRTVRYDWLAQYLFDTLEEVQEYATRWLWTYNHERPNTAIGGITPKQKLALAA